MVQTIRSARLDLVSMPPAFMLASLDGRLADAEVLLGAALPSDWPEGRVRTLRMRLDDLARNPAAQPWLLRAIVLRQPARRLVGHIGFHDPPGPEGTVEVGYSVLPPHQRQGYALEAVEALFTWATQEHGIAQFVASVGPWNVASLGLVSKLGFVQIGVQWDDEDGEELVFALDRRPGRPAPPPDP